MTITVATSTLYGFGVPPAVRLTITSTVTAIPEDFTAIRVHADGTTHPVLLETGARIIAGAAIVTDYCAPYNQAVTYQVSAGGTTGTSGGAWVLSNDTWLIHPSLPELSVRVPTVESISTRTRASRAARFQPHGDDLPLYRNEARRGGITGSMACRGPVGFEDTLDKLVDDDSVILINTPGATGWDIKWLWVQPLKVDYINKAGLVQYPYRSVPFDFEQVADPDVDQTPVWTSQDLMDYWMTHGAATSTLMATKYTTAQNAQIDNRI